MTVPALLRGVAWTIVVLALVDPAVNARQSVPARVRIDFDAGDDDARAVRDRVVAAVGDDVAVAGESTVDAVVSIDGAGAAEALRGSQPVSSITLETTPDVALTEAPDTIAAVPGRSIDVAVALTGRGMSGRTSAVTLTHDGAEVARVEHRWDSNSRAVVHLPYVAPTRSGLLTVRAVPVEGEVRTGNNRADIRSSPVGRAYQIAALEPRPSWPAGFVRRTLENDPAFRVSSIVQLSRGISARGGDRPPTLAPGDLARFDVVLVGAPEELNASQVRALGEFARVRGGVVVFVPDRLPAGPYVSLLPGPRAGLAERLLREPDALGPAGLRASELVVSAAARSQMDVLATTSAGEPVVFSRPEGDGRIVFSGALDAWRFRGDTSSRFDAFWREAIAAASRAAAPRIDVTVTPSVVRPGQTTRLTARLRRSEISHGPNGATADVSARIVDERGNESIIRLWPSPEAGTFAADIHVTAPGLHDVQVTTSSGASADTLLVAAERVRQPASAETLLAGIAEATGGVAVTSAHLQPLVDHLRRLPRREEPVQRHPMRSAWWMVPLAAALCAEWTIRRRRGNA